jgi:hypothetical protein
MAARDQFHARLLARNAVFLKEFARSRRLSRNAALNQLISDRQKIEAYHDEVLKKHGTTFASTTPAQRYTEK